VVTSGEFYEVKIEMEIPQISTMGHCTTEYRFHELL